MSRVTYWARSCLSILSYWEICIAFPAPENSKAVDSTAPIQIVAASLRVKTSFMICRPFLRSPGALQGEYKQWKRRLVRLFMEGLGEQGLLGRLQRLLTLS